MLKIIIGNKAYSSWSLRGWLAVKQSGLPYEELVLPMYDAAWDARKLQSDLAPSNGKVPTLWDGDTAIWDSLAIIDWLDTATGLSRFWPTDLAALALARAMAAEMHSSYVPLRKACPMNVRRIFPAQTPSAGVLENIARITSLWDQARNRFGQDGDFLFGAFGAADIMFAPVVYRLHGYSLPVASPIARAYIEAMLAHPWMTEWVEGANRESWVLDQYEGGANYG
ncbi:MAG: glutathione S-transferase family protein [Sphingobium sp.]